jgi:membrane associated rhomboid family serine protease
MLFDPRLDDISNELDSYNVRVIIDGQEYKLPFNRERVFNFSYASSFPPVIKHKNEFFRLLSATYQHGGIFHLAINMFSLFLVGRFFESIYGKYRFFVIYTVAGLASTFLSYLSRFSFTVTASVGASGSLFGLIGALLAFALINKHKLEPNYRKSLLGNILFIIILNLMIGFNVSGIDNLGHIGGLIGGLAAAFVIQPIIFINDKKETKSMKAVFLISIITVIVSLSLSLIWYFNGNGFNGVKSVFSKYASRITPQSRPQIPHRAPSAPQRPFNSSGQEI